MSSGCCSEDNEILLGKRVWQLGQRIMSRATKRRIEEEENKEEDDDEHPQHHRYNYAADTTNDIFSRLPFESILECRRVCKTWRTLIHQPEFSLTYLQRRGLLMPQQYYNNDDNHQHFLPSFSNNINVFAASSTNKNRVGYLFLCRVRGTREGLFYGEYDVNYINDQLQQQSSSEKVLLSIKRINHHPFKNNHCSIVGSCNGLICSTSSINHSCSVWCDPIYIYNPITAEEVTLPILYGTDLCHYVSYGVCHPWFLYIGFGYHSYMNEYKVVRILYDYSNDNLNYPRVGDVQENSPRVGKVQVYTLGAGTGWRDKGKIPYRLGGFSSPRSKAGVMANGALHWVDNKGNVVAFDLATEEFNLLPLLPTGFPPYSGEKVRLWVLGGVLYLLNEVRPRQIDVWSLKKMSKCVSSCYDMKNELECQSWSWSREFSKKADITINGQPIFNLTQSREFVLLHVCGVDQNLYRYGTRKKKIGNLHPALSIREAVPHVSSFISLKSLGEDAKIMRPLVKRKTRTEDEETKTYNRTS